MKPLESRMRPLTKKSGLYIPTAGTCGTQSRNGIVKNYT